LVKGIEIGDGFKAAGADPEITHRLLSAEEQLGHHGGFGTFDLQIVVSVMAIFGYATTPLDFCHDSRGSHGIQFVFDLAGIQIE
jgi:hypothetical protein